MKIEDSSNELSSIFNTKTFYFWVVTRAHKLTPRTVSKYKQMKPCGYTKLGVLAKIQHLAAAKPGYTPRSAFNCKRF